MIIFANGLFVSCGNTSSNEHQVNSPNSEKQESNQRSAVSNENKANLATETEPRDQKMQNSSDVNKSLITEQTKKNTDNEFEKRCGWFENPTPANASLFDREGEWIIGVQGGYQAEGDYPDFKPSEWVETNVHYGYGCACMQVKVNHKTHEVIEIKSSKVLPLSVCRKDKSLGKP